MTHFPNAFHFLMHIVTGNDDYEPTMTAIAFFLCGRYSKPYVTFQQYGHFQAGGVHLCYCLLGRIGHCLFAASVS
jgi:hypothetical protein